MIVRETRRLCGPSENERLHSLSVPEGHASAARQVEEVARRTRADIFVLLEDESGKLAMWNIYTGQVCTLSGITKRVTFLE